MDFVVGVSNHFMELTELPNHWHVMLKYREYASKNKDNHSCAGYVLLTYLFILLWSGDFILENCLGFVRCCNDK